jgi:hypothetical protein
MSNENDLNDQTDTTDLESLETAERSALFARAKAMGLEPARNINTEKLREMVAQALSDEPVQSVAPDEQVLVQGVTEPSQAPKPVKLTDAQIRKQQLKLVRVRISCMNPNKSGIECEPFSFINSVVNVTRVVPIDGREWHVEEVLLNVIREKKFQAFRTVKDARGRDQRVADLRPEFNVEVLKPLTPAELEELAVLQAREG